MLVYKAKLGSRWMVFADLGELPRYVEHMKPHERFEVEVAEMSQAAYVALPTSKPEGEDEGAEKKEDSGKVVW